VHQIDLSAKASLDFRAELSAIHPTNKSAMIIWSLRWDQVTNFYNLPGIAGVSRTDEIAFRIAIRLRAQNPPATWEEANSRM